MKRMKDGSNQAQKPAREYAKLPLWDKYQIEREGDRVTYKLGDGVSLDIVESNGENDFGSLNVYGLVVRVTYREIKKGERAGKIFVSYPSAKKKDGDYTELVLNYNKDLRDMIEIVLNDHYNS